VKKQWEIISRMIIEIVSPSTSFKDRNIKYQVYEFQGVKYYIIVDIDAKVAEVYQQVKDARNDTIRFQLDDNYRIDFAFENIWQL